MIRKAKPEDMDAILEIYEAARARMAQNGNPKQWKDGYPQRDILIADIENGHLFVDVRKNAVSGVFAFMDGPDPTYAEIEDGAWLDDAPYAAVHRVASDGKAKGFLKSCLSFCFGITPNLRIDTHHDNLIMQHLLEKNGFVRCGIIYVGDGTPRIAYQRKIGSEVLGV